MVVSATTRPARRSIAPTAAGSWYRVCPRRCPSWTFRPTNWWWEFERDAFRLETLDYYQSPESEDALAAFIAGQPQPPEYQRSSWVDTVRAATTAGKRIYRVHVLARPLSTYLQFELGWGYHRNQA